MKYKSTRGQVSGLSFSDALLMGLASDEGLLVPEAIPDVRAHLDRWRDLTFVELAQALIPKFIDDIDPATLRGLIADSYATFNHDDVVALQQLDGITVLELFHGPTLAFKDVALQLLGQLFAHVLGERGQRLNILGATSGDTGSAAIDGVRGQQNIDIFIMYPKGRVSPLQEMQMTTVDDDNVHCIEVEGSFDDCQNIMKTVFADAQYKATYHLGAVNSVNWARVLAQIVYYGYASLRSSAGAAFCVPTGNFGNVFAAYLAQRMGFPITHLLVATNDNDILARFFATGIYARGEVHQTLSPAMDIQVASNFERFLYYHFEQDSDRLVRFMQEFAANGAASIGAPPDTQLMSSVAVNRKDTLAAMHEVNRQYGYVLDPHTAVGYHAARNHLDQQVASTDVVVVATAHPAKFPDAVQQATGGEPTHPTLEALKGLPMRRHALPCDIDAVKAYLVEQLRSQP